MKNAYLAHRSHKLSLMLYSRLYFLVLLKPQPHFLKFPFSWLSSYTKVAAMKYFFFLKKFPELGLNKSLFIKHKKNLLNISYYLHIADDGGLLATVSSEGTQMSQRLPDAARTKRGKLNRGWASLLYVHQLTKQVSIKQTLYVQNIEIST